MSPIQISLIKCLMLAQLLSKSIYELNAITLMQSNSHAYIIEINALKKISGDFSAQAAPTD